MRIGNQASPLLDYFIAQNSSRLFTMCVAFLLLWHIPERNHLQEERPFSFTVSGVHVCWGSLRWGRTAWQRVCGGKLLGAWQPGSRKIREWQGPGQDTPQAARTRTHLLQFLSLPTDATLGTRQWTSPLMRSEPSGSSHCPKAPPLHMAALGTRSAAQEP